ncbi:MAG: DNA-binding protein [Eubacterium sp.]|nr:DNA-binding protein [Eubacterium sp.]
MKNASTPESLTDPQLLVDLARLYDTYGELLKKNQRDIFTDYVLENLSLSEIAEQRGISRQGVYDAIVRTRKKLIGYEESLKLLEKTDKLEDSIERVEKLLARAQKNETEVAVLKKIQKEIEGMRELI